MKPIFLLSAVLLLFCTVQGQSVKVMSYNIRVDFGGDGENNWEFRRDFLVDQIRYYAPDFIGTQEGKLHQLEYIQGILKQYGRVGRGRDNSENQGEFSAILYDKTRFTLISENTFWLSETPDIPESKSWETAYPRICTYGLFEDRKSKKRFYVFNTHMDHISEPARENGAKLILKKIGEINVKKLPVVVTGDFNSEMTTGAYKSLAAGLNDARNVSKSKPFGPSGTFNGFRHNEPVKLLIDYIFVSKENTEVSDFAVLSDSRDCRYPSDHLPVLAGIRFR